MKPIRLFIGSSPNGLDAVAEQTYEYTLRKNTARPLEIVWMRQTDDPRSFWSEFNSEKWVTPFSGFRWGIPEYCGYEGKAIYTDVDMLNFHDIGDLFDTPMEDKWMLTRGERMCTILFDCEKFKGLVKCPEKSDKNYHNNLYYFFAHGDGTELRGDLDPSWNSLDGDVEPFKLLHFTGMATQPWQPAWFPGEHIPHPRADLVKLFWDTVEESKTSGYNI